MRTGIISKVGLSFIVGILMLSGLIFAQGIEDIIGIAKDVGVFQFYLPFIIAFAILYGLLQKVQIFGDPTKGPAKSLNIIISLAIAAFVMVYTPVGITLSQFFTNLFGNAIVVILTFVVIAMFISILKEGKIFDFKMLTKGSNYAIGILLFVLIVVGVFVASGGTAIFPGLKISPNEILSPITRALNVSSTTLALIILIIGTGLIVWMVGKGEKAPSGAGGDKQG